MISDFVTEVSETVCDAYSSDNHEFDEYFYKINRSLMNDYAVAGLLW